MDPAYHIPLGADRLKLIGEICAIQGQIEWMMQNTVREAFKVDNPLTQRIMGSTSIGTNAEIWIGVVRRKQRRKGILAHAEQAFRDIKDLAEGRNDFVHAVYFTKNPGSRTGMFIRVAEAGSHNPANSRTAIAVRVRNRKEVSVRKLAEVRDIAAAISVRVAHVHWSTTMERVLREPSPWLGRLSELPVPSVPTPAPRQAKAQ